MEEKIQERIKELKKNLEIEITNLQRLEQVMNETKSKILAIQGGISELNKLLPEEELEINDEEE